MVNEGFFSGKHLGFDIWIQKIGLNITRGESDFKWLRDALKKEFPYACIPFLLKSHLKVGLYCILSLSLGKILLFNRALMFEH